MKLSRPGIVLIVLVAAAILCAQDKPVTDFRSAAAKDAKTAYLIKLSKIRSEAEIKVAVARKAYVLALHDAEKIATRSGDLDEALRIRDTAAQLSKDDKSAALDGLGLSGKDSLTLKLKDSIWRSPVGSLKFNADGTITQPDSGGQWSPVSDHAVLILYSSGWVDLWQFDDGLASYKGTHGHLEASFTGTRLQ